MFLNMVKEFLPVSLMRALRSPYHFFWACAAALVYGFPGRRVSVIGVTGTNGKTTVVHALHDMFRATGAGVASVSSLRFKINDREKPNLLKMTMPGRFHLQRFLAQARRAGCRTVILEVTSEGITQHRHRFIGFHGGVLTNITPEHIESHGSFAAYRAAKARLFRALPQDGFAVLNDEDPSAIGFAAQIRASVVRYGRSRITLPDVAFPVSVREVTPRSIRFTVGDIAFGVPLGGDFNVMNMLAAVAAGLASNIPADRIAASLARFKPPAGRLEYIIEDPFAVVVDYAHTPDALESVYKTLSSGNPKSEIRNPKLICVLGSAGGGRDKWKRPEMGKIAAAHCREVILTSEDPDDEDPARIVSEIQSGMTSPAQVSERNLGGQDDQLPMIKIVLDRRGAIREALQDAKPGDTVIITGMGAQPWFIDRGGKKIPWDEAAIAREELSRVNLF